MIGVAVVGERAVEMSLAKLVIPQVKGGSSLLKADKDLILAAVYHNIRTLGSVLHDSSYRL